MFGAASGPGSQGGPPTCDRTSGPHQQGQGPRAPAPSSCPDGQSSLALEEWFTQLIPKAAPRLLSLNSAVSFAQHLEQVEKDAMSKCSGQYDTANWLLSAEVGIFAADGCAE